MGGAGVGVGVFEHVGCGAQLHSFERVAPLVAKPPALVTFVKDAELRSDAATPARAPERQ